MKRIGLYLYDLRHPFVGLGEVEKSIAENIATRAESLKKKGLEFYFMVPKSWCGKFGNDVKYVSVDKLKFSLLKIPILRVIVRMMMPKMDLVHLTQQLPKIHSAISPFTLLTIHDLNFTHRKDMSRHYNYLMKRHRECVDMATHLSFISNFAMQDVNKYIPNSKPERVIYNGISAPTSYVAEMEIQDLPRNYLLHISGMAPNKNVDLLVKMMKYLPNEHLVLAGAVQQQKFSDRIFSLIKQENLSNVHFIGAVDSDTKWALYKSCKAFLFPSLCEGFGLPVGEAMYFGKPVFISRLTSLPEIGGESAYYFDELEPEKMAERLKTGLRDFEENRDLKEKQIKETVSKFSWNTAVDQYVAYYQDILSGEK